MYEDLSYEVKPFERKIYSYKDRRSRNRILLLVKDESITGQTKTKVSGKAFTSYVNFQVIDHVFQ